MGRRAWPTCAWLAPRPRSHAQRWRQTCHASGALLWRATTKPTQSSKKSESCSRVSGSFACLDTTTRQDCHHASCELQGPQALISWTQGKTVIMQAASCKGRKPWFVRPCVAQLLCPAEDGNAAVYVTFMVLLRVIYVRMCVSACACV